VPSAAVAAPVTGLRVRLARPGWTSGLALGGYALLAALFFGVRLLGHDGHTYLGIHNGDPELETWAFAWWPHAILHGQNPFYTHAVWAPEGIGLAWPTMAPGIVLAFSPVTLLLGPLAAFDLAQTLMPALAAWTAFLLCRHVTRSVWPSLVGGYLFGFSPYMLGQLQGHLHLTAVFLVPLAALVVLRYVEGGLDGRGLAVRLGVLVGLELWIALEVTFTLTLALVTCLVLAYLLVPSSRARLRTIPLPLLGAYGVAALVASPLLYYLLTDFHGKPFNPISPVQYSTDLLNLVVPSDLAAASVGWAHAISKHFTGFETEQGGYIGIPALAILVWFGVRRWRSPVARFLLVAVALGVFVEFGSWLHVDGHQFVTLPWEHVGYFPLLNNVLTARLSLYVALGIAVIVAMWAASSVRPTWARYLLPALAILATAPNLSRGDAWSTTTVEPTFITQGLYKTCLRKTDNVLVFPFGFLGNSMLWQAQTGFWYRMASGYVSAVPPPGFTRPKALATLAVTGELPSRSLTPIRQFIQLKGVNVILVEKGPEIIWNGPVRTQRPNVWPGLLAGLGVRPADVGGVLLYRFDGPSACRSSTTRQRNASSAAAGSSTVSSARSGP
jgi:hypothetical protein